MSQFDPTDAELVVQLARVAVERLAPEELMTFRRSAELFLTNPRQLARRAKDGPLGFGVGEAVVLVTPTALAVAAQVATELKDRFAADAADSLYKRLREFFGRSTRAEESTPVSFAEEQVAHVHKMAYEAALQAGLPEPRAALLASAMRGRLPLA